MTDKVVANIRASNRDFARCVAIKSPKAKSPQKWAFNTVTTIKLRELLVLKTPIANGAISIVKL